jgi:glycosyltransferase involved in cell wall biosynthesis
MIEKDKVNILFRGWFEIPHSYAMVNCFQIVNLYKKYKDKINFYIEEMPYFRQEWNNSRKLVYNSESNEIIKKFKKWKGEKLDLIYSITYPYDINMFKNDGSHQEDTIIPKCVFYTSEFATLDTNYFSLKTPILSDDMIREYISKHDKLYMTSPSVWSSKGMEKYGMPSNRNRIITHGVDTDLFKYDISSRNNIRNFYGVKDDEILLINIGSMTKNKGMLFILQSLNILVNKLNKKYYKLLLKGTADLYNSKRFLEIYFEELQNGGVMTKEEMQNLLSNHIIFTDKTLSYSKINDLFNAADLYLSPYLAEGFNLTCLESLSANLPVMVPSTGSTKEYIEDIYNNGGENHIFYIKSEVINVGNGLQQNEITMESLLNTLLQNEERIKMIRSNRLENKKMNVFIKNNYSWVKVSELLYDYFMYIIKGA